MTVKEAELARQLDLVTDETLRLGASLVELVGLLAEVAGLVAALDQRLKALETRGPAPRPSVN